MTNSRTVLLVEDNKDDVFLMQRALQGARIANPVIVVETGQEAIDYLSGAGKFADRDSYPIPAVVFLDLKLPFIYGHELLAWIRRQKQFESLIVIVLTSSNEASDLSRCYSLGRTLIWSNRRLPSSLRLWPKLLNGSGWSMRGRADKEMGRTSG